MVFYFPVQPQQAADRQRCRDGSGSRFTTASEQNAARRAAADKAANRSARAGRVIDWWRRPSESACGQFAARLRSANETIRRPTLRAAR